MNGRATTGGGPHSFHGSTMRSPNSQQRPSFPAQAPSTPSSNPAPAISPTEFLNRDLTWLEFNRRVLHEALDPRTPLLERVGFLAIFNSNLDEFFQKRVGGLKRQLALGITALSPDGLAPREQWLAIRAAITTMLEAQAECYTNDIRPNLAQKGIHLLRWNELTADEKKVARDYFKTSLFQVLTPLAVDPGHPFPFISNLSNSLGVMLRHPPDAGPVSDAGLEFARVKIPTGLPRWIRVAEPAAGEKLPVRLVHLADVIRYNLQDLFEGMIIEEVEPFRITRNADIEREGDEPESDDLLESIEQELRERRFAEVIRLEVDNDPSPRITSLLMEQLELEQNDVYKMPAEMDYTDLRVVTEINEPKLKYEPWTPITPPRLVNDDAGIFNAIRQGDILVHHPYESFTASVERFIRAAAKDPKVVTIKLTLYRTSKDSPFLPELIRAAEAGKQVVALIELKARFDEQRNIQIAQALEKAGVHVVYGLIGLKTHTKTALVVRQEGDVMRSYAHIGTGNYNPKTAQLYTDLGLFTCNPAITGDLVHLFHILTGRSLKKDFDHLLIAPVNMKRRFVELIDRETAQCEAWKKRGGDANDPMRPHIIAKMNSLEDRGIVRKLYEASRAGVKIQLIVRGFCCLRPGVAGMSENISVLSVIGRFLEHSRIYYFSNQGKPEYYIGSADWMYRNLNNRVEAITPILDAAPQARLKQILDIMLKDQRQAWDMHSNGSYTQRKPDPEKPETAIGTHHQLMELARREALISQAT